MFSMKIHFYTSIAGQCWGMILMAQVQARAGFWSESPNSCCPAAPGQQVRPSAVTLRQMMQSPIKNYAGEVSSPVVQQQCGKQIITPSVPLARARGAEHAAGAAAGPASPRECPWPSSLGSSRAGSSQGLQEGFPHGRAVRD